MIIFFKKNATSCIFKPFSTGMDLDFYTFLATAKSQKNIKYFS